MGHERTGTLPKSKRWRDIVGAIGALTGGEFDVEAIAAETLRAVRLRLNALEHDPAPLATFTFLVELAVAAAQTGSVVGDVSTPVQAMTTPLALASALRSRLALLTCEPEYREIAAAAGADALALWYRDHQVQDLSLFEDLGRSDRTWAKLGRGDGFCELSRIFFGRLVERYLSYFLEREASRVAPSLSHRDQLRRDLSAHLDQVSHHAFETSRITQSFAAGWFNRHSPEGMPSRARVRGFFGHALSKLRDELAREALQA